MNSLLQHSNSQRHIPIYHVPEIMLSDYRTTLIKSNYVFVK